MANLYTDQNVSAQIVPLLQARGHQIVAARQLGLERAGDERHLLTAARNDWILITNDRDDFRLLHDAWLLWSADWQVARTHAGILIGIQEWPAMRAADKIDTFLLRNPRLVNRLYEFRTGRDWVQR